jgi:hypothetical protein
MLIFRYRQVGTDLFILKADKSHFNYSGFIFWNGLMRKVYKFALPKTNGAVAQVVRALDSYPPVGGREFRLGKGE